jgi:hypothetical protein
VAVKNILVDAENGLVATKKLQKSMFGPDDNQSAHEACVPIGEYSFHYNSNEFEKYGRNIHYTQKLPAKNIFADHSGECLVVPKGHVWLEGDNSLCSLDSRDYGPVPMALVNGKVVCRLIPSVSLIK